MHPVPSSSTLHHVRGIICFGPDVSPHGFVLCKKRLVGLRSVGGVYKILLASIPKRCGTLGCTRTVSPQSRLRESVVGLDPQWSRQYSVPPSSTFKVLSTLGRVWALTILSFVKRCIVGLRSVGVVYKLPLASIPKQCGTLRCTGTIWLIDYCS
jgi:hypothetical protein